MRSGSCPKRHTSPPEPSFSLQRAIFTSLPVVLVLILLPPLAFASPPDPSWVAGFYDGADGDDIVSLIYETSAANHTASSHLGPLPCLLDISLDGIGRHVPDRHFTRGPRSPPFLRSPEFVSVFNALPPPTPFTKAPVTLPSLVHAAREAKWRSSSVRAPEGCSASPRCRTAGHPALAVHTLLGFVNGGRLVQGHGHRAQASVA